MLFMFVDTSSWLDVAKDINGQKLIVTIRVLAHQGHLELLVPLLVIDEFERNHERVEAAMTQSLSAQFRLVRAAIDEHGRGAGRKAALGQLDDLAHRVPLINQMATRNFDDITELLRAGRVVAPTPADTRRALQRGLDKRAPFHRGAKNSAADALLIEMYGSALDAGGAGDNFCFVTSNTSDFSASGGDTRIPHHDLSALFADDRPDYFTTLTAALAAHFPDELDELLEEFDYRDEPRRLDEILAAEQEMFDRVWHYRSFRHADPIGAEARARLEERYGGTENLGPYDDFEWGMINGKLSTLRWLLGSDWDFLDT